MVNEDVANRIKAAVDAQLAKRGLGELRYEVCSWRDRLYFVFAKEIGHENDRQLSAVARSVVSSFKEEILAKISNFQRLIQATMKGLTMNMWRRKATRLCKR